MLDYFCLTQLLTKTKRFKFLLPPPNIRSAFVIRFANNMCDLWLYMTSKNTSIRRTVVGVALFVRRSTFEYFLLDIPVGLLIAFQCLSSKNKLFNKLHAKHSHFFEIKCALEIFKRMVKKVIYDKPANGYWMIVWIQPTKTAETLTIESKFSYTFPCNDLTWNTVKDNTFLISIYYKMLRNFLVDISL